MRVEKLAAGLVLLVLGLAACGSDNEPTQCDPIAATLISRIEIAPTTATLSDGESLQLNAAAFSCDGTRLAAPAFTWQSEDAATVSVTPAGMAVAVKIGGPVTVTAAAQGKQGTSRITVAPRSVATVQVEPATASVALGRTSTLVARAFDAQGGELAGRPATWSSDDPGIVSVSASGGITGVAIGGPATITATVEGVEGSAQVTVVTAAVATITVSPPTSTIPVGATAQLLATLRDDQGAVLTGRAVVWTASDPVRASVSTSGLVTGLAPGGPVTILASSEGRNGSAQVTVNPLPLGISTSSLPSGTVGVAYNQALSATGGVQPYGWSIASGSLPPGLSLGSGGVVAGTPTANGSYPVTVRVTDAASQSATRLLTIDVGAALSITTSSLPPATLGASYSQQLAASGGSTPYSWTVASGTLPSGLGLGSGGALTGTPTTAGSSTFILQVSDAGSRSATRAFTLVVGESLEITTTTLPGGTVGSSYSQQLAAAGGATPYTWVVSSGSLPPGLTLSAAGLLSGTPTGEGSQGFTVQVTDAASRTATRDLTVTVSAALDISTTTLPGGTVGTEYSQQLSATGGTAPYSWTLALGSLPAGLDLSSTGLISGAPTTAGTASFAVRVTDALNRVATQALTLEIVSALGITTTTLAPATSSVPYSQTLTATGGTPPYSWSLAEGTSLPPGLTLGGNGELSGTPTTAGDYTFTVQVNDGGARSATQALDISVAAGEPSQIVWLRQPVDAEEDERLSPGPIVGVRDAAGNRVRVPIAVTMSLTRPSSADFTSSSVTTVTTIDGSATFDNLRVNRESNSARMRASAGSLQSAESANFRVR